METKNAIIRSTMLGREDHGILTAFMHLDYGGSGQGFGGYCLKGAACGIFVAGILDTLEVDKWESLAGKSCRVRGTDNQLVEIGHFIKDYWFNPKNEFAEAKKCQN